jgi:ATP-dependent protease ClpP protease subunit
MFKLLMLISLVLAFASPAAAATGSPPTGTCEVTFSGAVSEWIVDKTIADINRTCSKEWKLKINITSGGGQMVSAIRFHDFLVDWPHEVQTHGVNVQSAAVVIFLAGDVRTMSKDGVLMIHQIASELKAGVYTREDLLTLAKALAVMNRDNINFIARTTQLSKREVKKLVAAGTEMTAQRAMELGFVNEVVP